MTGDALTRLAQKSIGSVGVVRPILRPVFGGALEPAPLFIESPLVETGATDVAMMTSQNNPDGKHLSRAEGALPRSNPIEATPERIVHSTPFSREVEERKSPVTLEQRFHEALAEQRNERAPMSVRPPFAVADRSSSPIAGVAVQPRSEPTPIFSEPPAILSASRDRRQDADEAESLAAQSRENATRTHGDRYSVAASSSESTYAGGPVVQVTIGRVDVRAITPPAPPPMPSAPPRRPRLTLEAYLRGENRS